MEEEKEKSSPKADVKEVETEDTKENKKDFDFMELLNNPALGNVAGSLKDVFKKKETDPDTCEISIKAPSKVVLKLFRIDNEK